MTTPDPYMPHQPFVDDVHTPENAYSAEWANNMETGLDRVWDAVTVLQAGAVLRAAPGAPAGSLGKDGDFYIDTAAHAIYGPRSGGAWGTPTSMTGQPGPAGASGILPYTAQAGTTVNLVAGRWYGLVGGATATLPVADAAAVAASTVVEASWDSGTTAPVIVTQGSDLIITAAGTTTATAPIGLPGEVLAYQAVAVNRWRPVESYKALSQLDQRYGPILNTQLIAWVLAGAWRIAGGTSYDVNGTLSTASIVWPDGSTGTFTLDVASMAFPGAIDAYHVTYVSTTGAIKTVTQPAVTRDGGSNITVQPALTIA